MNLPLLALLAATTALAQSEIGTRVASVTVFDSTPVTPKAVGNVILIPSGIGVLMQFQGVVFTIPLLSSGTAFSLLNGTILYDGPNCTGKAYSNNFGSAQVITKGLPMGPAATVYLAIGPQQTVDIVKSRFSDNIGGCKNTTQGSGTAAFPIAAMANLYDIYTPPFHIEAQTY